MKICIWTASIFKLGGIKRVITVVGNELVEKHDITIMTYDNPSIENREMYGLDERIKIDYVGGPRFKDKKNSLGGRVRTAIKVVNNKTGIFDRESTVDFLTNAFYPKKVQDDLVEYINSKDYDVVVATAGLTLLLAVISERLNAKTIGWQHNCYDAYVKQKNTLFWKKEHMLQKYFPKLDRFLVLNKYDKEDYANKLGIECTVMENPRSFVSEEKTDTKQKQFFVAARFVEAKGLDLLLDSYKKFCEVNDEWNMIIAGDGPLRSKVLKDVWKKGLQERIKFTGVTDNVRKYFLESSIYLLSSRWEGWGLVVIEAFEMGQPVIAYDIVPIDQLITDGEDGFIIPKFDTDQFAKAMFKLAEDEELRQRMADKAIEKAKHFSVERICEDWERLLQSL